MQDSMNPYHTVLSQLEHLRAADKALYQAKAAGRNCLRIAE